MDEYLDESIMLSSMSPTINKCLKKSKKQITKLALRKELKRSSMYDKLPHTGYDVLLSASDTTETISTSSGNSTKCITNLYKNTNNGRIDHLKTNTCDVPTKLSEVEKWVAKVNSESFSEKSLENVEACNISMFSELSTIVGENNKSKGTVNISNTHFAINSTFVKDRNCFRFDEMFHKTTKESLDDFDKLVYNAKNNDTKVNCEHETGKSDNENQKNIDIVIVNDSFDENQCVENEMKIHEKLLDDMYGNCWRVNRERILTPKSEPRQNRKVKDKAIKDVPQTERKPKQSITHKNPYLISEINKSEKLLHTLQTARLQMIIGSPFMGRLKDICDTDSSIENSPIKCKTKLNFSDCDDEDIPKVVDQNSKFDKHIKAPRNRKKCNTNNGIKSNLDSLNSNNVISRALDNTPKKEIEGGKKLHTQGKGTFKEIDSNEKRAHLDLSKLLVEAFDNARKNIKSNNLINSTKSKKTEKIDSDDQVTLSPEGKLPSKLKELNLDKEKKIISNVNLGNKIKKDKNGKNNTIGTPKSRRYTDSSSNESSNYDDNIIKQSTDYNRQSEKNSFLASLSANIPIDKCEVSARIYRNTYKTNKEELAKKLFTIYNEKIFSNKIPFDTPLEWNDRLRGTAGFCYCRKITRSTGAIERNVRIVLATKVLDSADRLRDTLVHEMCHAATWIVNDVKDGHGQFWKAWATKAMKTFPELPQITRCHEYVINTKYTYKCTSCGYCIGRHSKSLDIERKRCGYCYGKFEVFLNKTTKNGTKAVTPVTPRKATGFALFVKENYGNTKKDNMNHAHVMKILSKKFNELKTK